jgi:predicted DNA-binding WGR domain protein
MLEVLARGIWSFGGGVLWRQKLEGQVTKFRWFGHVFYVRENLDGSQAFYISANERQGEKGGVTGYGRPVSGRNVLEVCTRHAADWSIAADVVRSLDALERPVRSHRRFTPTWAEALLAQRRSAFPTTNHKEHAMKRRFEFIEGSSSKFYEIYVSGARVDVRFGRIGTSGQSIVRTFENAATANEHADKLVKQNTGKGYLECAAT